MENEVKTTGWKAFFRRLLWRIVDCGQDAVIEELTQRLEESERKNKGESEVSEGEIVNGPTTA